MLKSNIFDELMTIHSSFDELFNRIFKSDDRFGVVTHRIAELLFQLVARPTDAEHRRDRHGHHQGGREEQHQLGTNLHCLGRLYRSVGM